MIYILASASPRRKELLAKTGISFRVIPSDLEETITKTVPSDIVMELATGKAEDVYQKLLSSPAENLPQDSFMVLGADTIVVYRDEILGKPADKREACDMLSLLADRTHQVYTGVALIINKNGRKSQRIFYEKTDVTFYPISREDIYSYAESGDPLDKAGSYGIQGSFAIHVKGITGDYNNVVGLPLGRLYQELIKL